MTSEVVSIRGKEGYAPKREPNPDVVAAIEDLLERARSGEIVGIAGAVMYFDKASGSVYRGWKTLSQLGDLHVLAHRMAREFDEGRYD